MSDHVEAIARLRAAGHRHADRFAELCEDDSDPARRDGMRGVVIVLARGELPQGPAPPPVAVDYAIPEAGPCGGCP